MLHFNTNKYQNKLKLQQESTRKARNDKEWPRMPSRWQYEYIRLRYEYSRCHYSITMFGENRGASLLHHDCFEHVHNFRSSSPLGRNTQGSSRLFKVPQRFSTRISTVAHDCSIGANRSCDSCRWDLGFTVRT